MKTGTKMISVVLALVFMASAAISVWASSTSAKTRTPADLLDTDVDAYAKACEENPEKKYEKNYWDYLNDTLYAYMLGTEEKGLSLPEAFAQADDETKAQMILLAFYGLGYEMGPYSILFPNGMTDMIPGFVRFSSINGDAKSSEDLEELLSQQEYFSYTPSFQEYLQIMIHYLGSGKKTKTITLKEWDSSEDPAVWNIYAYYDVGTSFYDISDTLAEKMLSDFTVSTMPSSSRIYNFWMQSCYKEHVITKAEYVKFLRAVYSYMYPSVGHFGVKNKLSDITKVTDVTNVTSTKVNTDITKVTFNRNVG